MTAIPIPDAVVEAAARAEYEQWRDYNELREETLPWSELDDDTQADYRASVRAALIAGLKAWPGFSRAGYAGENCIILPLPMENTND